MMDNQTNGYYTIDLLQLVKGLWHRAWMIVLAGLLVAGIGFSISAFLIPPTYSSSIMLYVNNSSASSNPNGSISNSDLIAAQSLVNTYAEILDNRTSLEQVIDAAGVSYTYKELSGMIKATSANETEIMRITVTTEDPYESAKIANAIADVLPGRIATIIEGSSVKIVERAIPVFEKVAPSITKYTVIGGVLGVLGAVLMLAVFIIMDDTIQNEEYVIQTYECPILAKIPDLAGNEGSRYAYYYKGKHKNSTQESNSKS